MTAHMYCFTLLTPYTHAIRRALTDYATEVVCDYALLAAPYPTLWVLFLAKCDPKSQLALARGCRTLQIRLGLPLLPRRLVFRRPFMEKALRTLFGDAIPPPLAWKGLSMTHDALQAHLTRTESLLNTENSLKSLLDSRLMKLGQVSQVAHTRACLASEAAKEEFRTRPTCVEPIHLVFYKYDKYGRRLPA
jgi:hypothetical protein